MLVFLLFLIVLISIVQVGIRWECLRDRFLYSGRPKRNQSSLLFCGGPSVQLLRSPYYMITNGSRLEFETVGGPSAALYSLDAEIHAVLFS